MRDRFVLRDPHRECADPNPNRWHCMRGHDGAPPGICPLPVCESRGANSEVKPDAD